MDQVKPQRLSSVVGFAGSNRIAHAQVFLDCEAKPFVVGVGDAPQARGVRAQLPDGLGKMAVGCAIDEGHVELFGELPVGGDNSSEYGWSSSAVNRSAMLMNGCDGGIGCGFVHDHADGGGSSRRR